jgi:hypothetical protein
MMENAGTHYLIKTQTQIAHLFDGELVKLKVCQIVFSLELFRPPDTDRATVNPRNLSFGPPQCMLGGLGCSTTGNEDGLVRCRLETAKRDESQRGVFAGLAKVVDTGRDCRSAGDTDSGRRTPERRLRPPVTSKDVLWVSSRRCFLMHCIFLRRFVPSDKAARPTRLIAMRQPAYVIPAPEPVPANPQLGLPSHEYCHATDTF